MNERNQLSRTALHIAAEEGHEALAQGRPCWAQGRTSTRQTRTGARCSTGPYCASSPRLPRCCWRTGPKSMCATMTVAQRWQSPGNGAFARWRRCSCKCIQVGSETYAVMSQPRSPYTSHDYDSISVIDSSSPNVPVHSGNKKRLGRRVRKMLNKNTPHSTHTGSP